MNTLIDLIRTSIVQPKKAVDLVRMYPLSIVDAGCALASFVVLGVIVVFVMNGLEAVSFIPNQPSLMPIPMAIIVLCGVSFLTVGLALAGQAFGGKPNLRDAFVVMAWWQFLQFLLQIGQLVLATVSMEIAGLFSLISGGYLFWVLVNFIAALHGFDSLLKAVGTLVIAIFGLVFALSIVLQMLGLAPPPVSL